MKGIERLDNKMLGGVCAGLARNTNVNIIIIRLLVVFGTFFSAGTTILIYLICWILFPLERTATIREGKRKVKISYMVILGIVLFGISPILLSLIGMALTNNDVFVVFHWLALITFPIATTAFFTYVVFAVFVRAAQDN